MNSICKQGKLSNDVLKLLKELKDDHIGQTVKNDFHILKLGEYMLHKYKNFRSNQTQFCIIRMRQLGALMNYLQKKKIAVCSPSVDSEVGGIKTVICPERFEDIKDAALEMARDPNDPKHIIVTKVVKVQQAVKKVAQSIMDQALRRTDDMMGSQKLHDKAERFYTLMENNWIHTGSLRKKYDKKIEDCDSTIPQTKDVKNLVTGVKRELQEAIKEIEENPCKNAIRKLQRCLLIRLTVFNARRIGEVSRMRTIDFETSKRARTQRIDNEEFESFTELEREVAKHLLLLRFRGKVGRHVRCLAPKDAEDALEILSDPKNRRIAGILPENDMIFATPGSRTHIQGVSIYRKFAEKYCERPERMRGTKMRKYIATNCQILDLGHDGKNTLCEHLGHELNVHNEFYRKHSDLVEKTKIAQILWLAEAGKLPDNKGKNMDELDVTEHLFEAEMYKKRMEKEGHWGDQDPDEGQDSDVEIVAGETPSQESTAQNSNDQENGTVNDKPDSDFEIVNVIEGNPSTEGQDDTVKTEVKTEDSNTPNDDNSKEKEDDPEGKKATKEKGKKQPTKRVKKEPKSLRVASFASNIFETERTEENVEDDQENALEEITTTNQNEKPPPKKRIKKEAKSVSFATDINAIQETGANNENLEANNEEGITIKKELTKEKKKKKPTKRVKKEPKSSSLTTSVNDTGNNEANLEQNENDNTVDNPLDKEQENEPPTKRVKKESVKKEKKSLAKDLARSIYKKKAEKEKKERKEFEMRTRPDGTQYMFFYPKATCVDLSSDSDTGSDRAGAKHLTKKIPVLRTDYWGSRWSGSSNSRSLGSCSGTSYFRR